MLTPQQVEQYEDQGFLVIPAFTPPAQVAALQARGVALAEAHAPAARAATFSTSSQNNTTDAYFQESANNVSVFFEEGAFGPNGALLRPPPFAQSVNKLGHALHDVDEIFRTWARSPAVAAVLRALGYKRPLIVQSMYHMKPAGVGSEVALHQDSTFLHTSPPSVVGLWLALEDATLDNGCMWAAPGVHKAGVARRFVHRNGRMTFEGEMPAVDPAAFVPLPVPAGSLVLLHGANQHYSNENRSAASRHAFIIHVVEGAEGYTWDPLNWLQRRPEFPFEPLYDDTAPPAAGEASGAAA